MEYVAVAVTVESFYSFFIKMHDNATCCRADSQVLFNSLRVSVKTQMACFFWPAFCFFCCCVFFCAQLQCCIDLLWGCQRANQPLGAGSPAFCSDLLIHTLQRRIVWRPSLRFETLDWNKNSLSSSLPPSSLSLSLSLTSKHKLTLSIRAAQLKVLRLSANNTI